MLCFYKVGDYHKIIKEPMDFGTMRAKLHEGMYATFEQFEVCSISPQLLTFLSFYTSAYSKKQCIYIAKILCTYFSCATIFSSLHFLSKYFSTLLISHV